MLNNGFDINIYDRKTDISDEQYEAAQDIDYIQDLEVVPQCFWGTWVMTEELHGQNGWGECRNVPKGLTVKFTPAGFSFQNDYKEVLRYSCSLIAIADINEYYREAGQFHELGMEGDYYLIFSPEWDDWKDEIGWGWEYILISETELIIPEARNGMYKMEKVEGYTVTEEEADNLRISPYRSMCYGTWEVTEQLGELCEYVSIGDKLDMQKDKGYFVSCRILNRREECVEKAAEWIGLGDGNNYLVCCYFSEDYFWDYMIIKDGMTAVLVKGECLYQVKRISDSEKDCIYYELL